VPHLVLAGRGALPTHLKQLITELGLTDCVSVRSDVPQDELPSLYGAASVYLQTSPKKVSASQSSRRWRAAFLW
jgi:glycosyltransferase involved in cell wall biosynthesis